MSPEKPRDEMIGRKLGRDQSLTLVRLIGQGGSGTIYMGWDEAHQRAVAVKFLHRDYSSNPVLLERFRREGELFSQIDHPNIVKIFGLHREQGRVFIVTEYVPGKNLYQILKHDGEFPIRRALAVCRDVASALAEAHRHSIVHRDLKPENIMIRTTDDVVKILDFGIAKDLNAADELTQLGTYIGTPSYSSPEQIRGEKVDHRADVFSLGVILYELLTGKLAFDGRHSTEILHATMKERPIPIHELNTAVTTPVARLIDRMIEKLPIHRFQDMGQVMQEIDRILPQVRDEYSQEEVTTVRKVLKGIFQK